MNPAIDYTLYLVTDRGLMSTPDLESAVEQAIAGGVTVVQLREKELDSLGFYRMAETLKRLTARFNVPLIINDRVDVALAVDAEGVHVGQSDLPASVVRDIIGRDKIMGVSVTTLEEAKQAARDGADYLGVGTLFPTMTKRDATFVSLPLLEEIADSVPLPLVGIGGITAETLPQLRGVRMDGIAVVSAILSQKNIEVAAREMKRLFNETR